MCPIPNILWRGQYWYVKEWPSQIVSHFDICEGTSMPNSGCVSFAAAYSQYSHTVLIQGSCTRPLCACSTHTVLTQSSPQRSHHKRSKWPTVRPTTVSPRLCTCSGGPTIGWLVQLLVGRLFAQVVQHSNHWLGDYLLRWSGGWVPWPIGWVIICLGSWLVCNLLGSNLKKLKQLREVCFRTKS